MNRKDASGTADVCVEDFNQDNNPFNDLGNPTGSGGGNGGGNSLPSHSSGPEGSTPHKIDGVDYAGKSGNTHVHHVVEQCLGGNQGSVNPRYKEREIK